MDEGQVIADFLFPTDKQAPRTVRPGVTAFDDPTVSALPGATLTLDCALARNVWNVVEASRERFCGTTAVALVQTEMLPAPSGRLGTRHGHRLQRGTQQFDVVSVGTSDRDAQRHAATIGHDRSFDAKLTTIGGVFAGFFPHLTATWSWSRPLLANAIRFRVARHTSVDIVSRSGRRLAAGSIPESTDAPYLANRTVAAMLSTDNRFARDRRFRWRLLADSREADRPSDCADTWATMAPIAATSSPVSAQTDRTNRDAYPPPCIEQMTSITCSTLVVAFCSVLG